MQVRHGGGFAMTRRRAAAVLGGAVATAPFAGSLRAQTTGPFRGAALYADVEAYAALGVHRTATPGDDACTRWLHQRLALHGFSVAPQSFQVPLAVPRLCRLEVKGKRIETLPAWPVTPTSHAGVSGPLATADASSLAGKIAVIDFSYGAGADSSQARYATPIAAALAKGPAAIVAITEGPTGGIIELNQAAGQTSWPVPFVIAGGADGASILAAAAAGTTAKLISTRDLSPQASASNVVARRQGDGPTIVVSTPKSGWFQCAAERGSGMAVFLALAAWLARTTTRDLVFVSTSGHELGEIGAALFLRTQAPPPAQVAAWLHLGADVAAQAVTGTTQLVGTGQAVATRQIFVTPGFEPAAKQAFAGQPGYQTPTTLGTGTVPGELEQIRDAGYTTLFGLVGSGPLFHTRDDRLPLATRPAILAPVATGVRDFMAAFLAAH